MHPSPAKERPPRRDLTRNKPKGTLLAERREAHRRAAMAQARSKLAPVDATVLERVGLTAAQLQERRTAELTNVLSHESSRSIWAIVRANVFTLFNTVLGCCLAVVLLVGDPRDALFGFIVVANAAIGVVQEYRAKRTLDRLAVLHAPRARVLRSAPNPAAPRHAPDHVGHSHEASDQGGQECEIAVADVVQDDVLLLRTGDQIPADALVLTPEALEVDESLLTGESEPVEKQAGDMVLSGSAVVGGYGTARVHRVGAESYASALTAEARRFSLVNSEIRNSINRIIVYIAWALIPIIALVVNGQMRAHGGWRASIDSGDWRIAVVSAVASIVAMIPEGLVLLTSISFGMAAVVLARKHVLVQELPAVEGLARVDMVCLDKTGTLTEGRMELASTTVLEPVPGFEQVLAWLGSHPNANATAAALSEDYSARPQQQPTAALNFNSARKFSAVRFGSPEMSRTDMSHTDPRIPDPRSPDLGKASQAPANAGTVAQEFVPAAGDWVFGAPEIVLSSATVSPAEGASGANHGVALAASHDAAGRGLRAVLLAFRPAAQAVGESVGSVGDMSGHGGLEGDTPSDIAAVSGKAALEDDFELAGLQPVALLLFREKVRPDAAQTLQYFRDQGVALKIISGDNPRTVAAVARDVGFDFDGDGYDARKLPEDAEAMAEVLERESVLGRVTPEQKRGIVLALQSRGHVVAMTGDGVNDALALKHADIGIAMGSGAAATKAVSRLVLLDGQFSHLPSVVAEGRRVIANVERVANLFLTKTTYAILISIVIGLLSWRYPFLPRQLSIVSSMTIGIPAFFLALLPNARRYQPGFLRRTLLFALPSGTIVAACIMAVYAFARTFPNTTGGEEEIVQQAQTAVTMTVLLVALWILGTLVRPFEKWRALLVAAMVLGLVLVMAVPFTRTFFALDIPSGGLLSATIAVTAIGCVAIELLYRFLRKHGAVSERE